MTAQLKQEEEEANQEGRGTGLTEEDRLAFEGRKDDISEMRLRIQKRAEEMGVEKSANTAEGITKAAQNAAKNRGTSGELNLSVFTSKDEDVGEDLPKYLRVMKEKNEGRELSSEEKIAADPFSSMNIIAAMIEECKLVEWPSVGQVFRQTLVTSAVLLGTIFFIVTLDATLKELYQGVGLYPK